MYEVGSSLVSLTEPTPAEPTERRVSRVGAWRTPIYAVGCKLPQPLQRFSRLPLTTTSWASIAGSPGLRNRARRTRTLTSPLGKFLNHGWDVISKPKVPSVGVLYLMKQLSYLIFLELTTTALQVLYLLAFMGVPTLR